MKLDFLIKTNIENLVDGTFSGFIEGCFINYYFKPETLEKLDLKEKARCMLGATLVGDLIEMFKMGTYALYNDFGYFLGKIVGLELSRRILGYANKNIKI
ncbi:MAG: hypothetical protein KKF48_01900 [Nanoarchaeota archaeon]|nr:hypothetical protein [Nanoarchaeota archaeon]MBU1027773.1 hypothetical protein [Nanoarchaeota archaeon]